MIEQPTLDQYAKDKDQVDGCNFLNYQCMCIKPAKHLTFYDQLIENSSKMIVTDDIIVNEDEECFSQQDHIKSFQKEEQYEQNRNHFDNEQKMNQIQQQNSCFTSLSYQLDNDWTDPQLYYFDKLQRLVQQENQSQMKQQNDENDLRFDIELDWYDEQHRFFSQFQQTAVDGPRLEQSIRMILYQKMRGFYQRLEQQLPFNALEQTIQKLMIINLKMKRDGTGPKDTIFALQAWFKYAWSKCKTFNNGRKRLYHYLPNQPLLGEENVEGNEEMDFEILKADQWKFKLFEGIQQCRMFEEQTQQCSDQSPQHKQLEDPVESQRINSYKQYILDMTKKINEKHKLKKRSVKLSLKQDPELTERQVQEIKDTIKETTDMAKILLLNNQMQIKLAERTNAILISQQAFKGNILPSCIKGYLRTMLNKVALFDKYKLLPFMKCSAFKSLVQSLKEDHPAYRHLPETQIIHTQLAYLTIKFYLQFPGTTFSYQTPLHFLFTKFASDHLKNANHIIGRHWRLQWLKYKSLGPQCDILVVSFFLLVKMMIIIHKFENTRVCYGASYKQFAKRLESVLLAYIQTSRKKKMPQNTEKYIGQLLNHANTLTSKLNKITQLTNLMVNDQKWFVTKCQN